MRSPPDAAVDFAAKLDALCSPSLYPDGPQTVEVVETHKSWVFLTAVFAWKLKKPIHYNSIDLRTLESRHFNCREEVRLNRRLAEDVYVGVVPLTLSDGRLMLGCRGIPVEWIVQMRRLPADRMLDRQIADRSLMDPDIRSIALRLASFYRGLPPIPMRPDDYLQFLRIDITRSYEEALNPEYALPAELVPQVFEPQLTFLDAAAPLLESRASAGHIIEGHGDLRPAHICLVDSGPVIFDCLEFDRRLRLLDPVDELAFLAMECERTGAAGVGPILFEEYTRLTNDAPPSVLVSFYTAYRAGLWARLALWRAHEVGPCGWGTWLERAASYLRLAVEHAPVLSGGHSDLL